MKRVNLTEARWTVQAETPFRSSTGAFWGVQGAAHGTGRLPAEYASLYDLQRDQVVYTVGSYATPVAWKLADGTVVRPDVRHSVTTSRHQGIAAWLR